VFTVIVFVSLGFMQVYNCSQDSFTFVFSLQQLVSLTEGEDR
jgi:hypothetical protein